jgi:hypothetical protein
MKKKSTYTFSEELCDTLSYLSIVLQKNQNEILEDVFWEWWKEQDETLKNSINQMITLSKKLRER